MHQFIEAAILFYLPVFEDDDPVCEPGDGDSVGDVDNCFILCQGIVFLKNFRFCQRVQVAGRLVQNDQITVPVGRPGDRELLPLASGKIGSSDIFSQKFIF